MATAAPSGGVLQSIIALDASISLTLHTLFQFVPRVLLKTLEIVGDGRLFFPVALSLLLLLSGSPQTPHPFLLSLLLGAVLDLLLVGLLKLLVRRPRPVYNKSDMSVALAVDNFSFPSGHSSRVFFVSQFLALSVPAVREILQEEPLRRWVRRGFGANDTSDTTEMFLAAAFGWAVTMSVSRVLLGRHFVADVAAGACLGMLEGWITHRNMQGLLWDLPQSYRHVIALQKEDEPTKEQLLQQEIEILEEPKKQEIPSLIKTHN